MKAVILTQPGGIENLQLSEIPIPQPGNKEVLIQLKAISINPVDAILRANEAFLKAVLGLAEGEAPVILGWDVSGVVTATGPSATKFKVGDEVFGMIRFMGHGKAYAEYATAPEEHLTLKPGNISHGTAAAATLAALTAWQALVVYAKVKKGDKVLVHAAAGGLGSYAVQLAHYLGAYVVATGSPENKDFILQLGADRYINYKEEKFEEVIKDADIVLDSVGIQGHLDRSVAALKKGGRIISFQTYFDDPALKQKIEEKEIYAHRLHVTSSGEQMDSIASLLEQGHLRSYVTKTFSLDQIPEAHKAIETGRTRGKIVVEL